MQLARFPLLTLLLPAWVALLFYLPTLGYGYVWDDTYFLRDLPYLRDPALWWQAIQQPLFVSHNYFRPLPLLMFVAEAKLGGPGAFLFHLVNVLLHAANTLLLTLLARGLLVRHSHGKAWACAAGLLFALHPVLVENVSWISDRFDLTMTAFILLALLIEQRWREHRVRLPLLALCLAGALLSKETGIVLLALLPVWQLFLHMRDGASLIAALRGWRAYIGLYVLLALTVLAYLLLRHTALGFLYRADSLLVSGSVFGHVLLIGKTFATYALLLIFPFGQVAPVHPALTPIAAGDVMAWTGVILLLSVVGLVLRGVWRGQALLLLPLLALIALAPVANLLPLTIGDNIAHDRYLILPVAFTTLWLSCVLPACASRLPQALAAGWLLAAAVCVVLTVPHWESNMTLWSWAYDQHPQSQIAGANYQMALLDAGRDDEALALGRTLLAGKPLPGFDASMHHNLALVLMRRGELAEAEREIKLRLDLPWRNDAIGHLDISEALNLLAHIQLQQGRAAAAEANLHAAVRLTPHLSRPHYSLALLYYAAGRLAEGDAELALALRYASPLQVATFGRQAAEARAQAPGVAH